MASGIPAEVCPIIQAQRCLSLWRKVAACALAEQIAGRTLSSSSGTRPLSDVERRWCFTTEATVVLDLAGVEPSTVRRKMRANEITVEQLGFTIQAVSGPSTDA
ncbi:MAG: hypothetical protein AAF416_14470 [Pseudomonadota bacterium]